MFFYEGQSCPVCGQYFGEADDIVTCPECGAPHHRDCWKQEGHCHFAADHGTEQQWAKAEPQPKAAAAPTRKCPNCGKENPEFAEFCSHCGREIDSENWASNPVPPRVNQYTPPSYGHYEPFPASRQDPFGGIPRTEEIDGVSVETIVAVLGQNSAYYLPRFYKMSRTGKKTSWNWSAFLLGYNWLLYRKNLLWGWLCFAFLTVIDYFYTQAYEPLMGQLQQFAQAPATFQLPENAGFLYLILLITMAVMVVVQVVLGLFGNWLYMQNVLKKARRLRDDPDLQYNQSFLNTGGVSFAMAILPNLVLVFVQYIILLFSL